MKSFRDPKYVERYEDVIFDLETALNTTIANNGNQKKMATDSLLITAERLHHSTGIVSVRSHDYDVGEKLVPPYWRSEICYATPRVL